MILLRRSALAPLGCVLFLPFILVYSASTAWICRNISDFSSLSLLNSSSSVSYFIANSLYFSSITCFSSVIYKKQVNTFMRLALFNETCLSNSSACLLRIFTASSTLANSAFNSSSVSTPSLIFISVSYTHLTLPTICSV
eukprot:TRINITY_DN9019_c0_g1_i3.p1 TRINITY_DN9019_c0_g1~~TRINITY_DN9019_c0_g1_i3.p1  ORF type:complete len:140 (+),score=20.19 TRINITY_DN9019_c0_g1_i3:216-635(+)